MWTNADIQNAVVAHPQQATDALAAVQLGAPGPVLEAAALNAIAAALGRNPGAFWVEQLQGRGLLNGYARALANQGVPIDLGAVNLKATNVDPVRQAAFNTRAMSFRCRVKKNGAIAGSGTLVGPSTVLTAWHVIARAAPDQVQEPWPAIEVLLADGRHIPAYLPAQFASPCSTDEYANALPPDDAAVAGSCDVAVLRLARPVGALLGAASFPEQPAPYIPNATLFVVHYPEGKDVGMGVGAVTNIPNLTARWAHTVGARPGSSGGGCFDATLTLAGVHQGKDPQGQGRLVPTGQFHAKVREIIAQDQAPPRMWSLDGTPEGDFVISRQSFFEGFAAARREGRVRGIRVKRADASADLSGLPFSFRMLDRMVARSPDTRTCRISFEALVPDLVDDIARRAADAGVATDPVPPASTDTAPEAAGADRARQLAAAIDQRAGALGIQLWFFIDHPAIAFGDTMRATLEAFIDAALRLPHLRLVIAGFEAVALPGLEFESPPYPPDQGAPGLMTDIISGFAASDVRLFLLDASAAANRAVSPERIEELIALGLDKLDNVNGIYAPWLAGDVATRLRPAVAAFFEPVGP